MIYRGVPLPFMFFFLASGDTGYLVWGGGVLGYSVYVFYVLFIAVLVLAVFCFPLLVVPHIGRVLFLVLHAVVGSF